MQRSPTPEWEASFQSGQALLGQPSRPSRKQRACVPQRTTLSLESLRAHIPAKARNPESRMAMGDSVAKGGSQKSPYSKGRVRTGHAECPLPYLLLTRLPGLLHLLIPTFHLLGMGLSHALHLHLQTELGLEVVAGRDQVPFGAAPKPLPPAPCPPMGSSPWTWEQGVSLSALPGAPTLLLWQPASPAQPNPLTRCLTPAQSRLPEVGTVWQLLHLAFRL